MTDPLAPLLDLPGVADAVDRARVACEELRWHEAFRRRWREVRAEAGLRATRASCEMEGVRVPLSLVRSLATEGGNEPVVVGALRATALVERWMPALGDRGSVALPPLGQLLAQVHAAATGGWLPDESVGRLRSTEQPGDLRGLGPAPVADELAARVELLGRTVRESSAPALVVAAVVHGELLTLRPFAAANGVVARAVARLLLTARGLDPTGSLVPEGAWAAALNPYLGAAAGFATGSPDGVAAWVRGYGNAVEAGAAEARVIADGVLAGSLGSLGSP
ncbi:cell filamentation protein Fic [Cellulomonas sp. Root485]|uniref:Fic family protein n=1 Tax=Cellulomonas sp. Root485 TaxID=1736546 RepID=UPI0006FEA4AA|nr:Fic family protein [Cellulomonas sp. Root485]KQY24133.1 cell filamentation protein Fic [Cellulomonas sp. Root485]